MFSPQIEWNCSECRSGPIHRRKYCADCHSMLHWTCIGSEKSGLYTNCYRHRDDCSYCTPQFEEDRQQEMEEKQIAIQQQFQVSNDGK